MGYEEFTHSARRRLRTLPARTRTDRPLSVPVGELLLLVFAFYIMKENPEDDCPRDLELVIRIELMTSSLPMTCSTD